MRRQLRSILGLQTGQRGRNGRTSFTQRGEMKDLLAAKIFTIFVVNIMPFTFMSPDGCQTYSSEPTSMCMHMLNFIGYMGQGRNALPNWCHDNMRSFWNFCVRAFNYACQNYGANLHGLMFRFLKGKLFVQVVCQQIRHEDERR